MKSEEPPANDKCPVRTLQSDGPGNADFHQVGSLSVSKGPGLSLLSVGVVPPTRRAGWSLS